MKKLFLFFSIATVTAGILYGVLQKESNLTQPTKSSNNSPVVTDTAAMLTIAENLDTPWALVFLPDRSMLVTERKGTVRRIDQQGIPQTTPVATLENVKEIGEGGLLGMAIHPDFPYANYIYFYYTYDGDDKKTLNRVVRFKYNDTKLIEEEIIVDAIPGAPNHNGGRIRFGPDNFLYITTGDAQNPSLAQDKNSLAGKILRVTDEGRAAPGNPFDNLVYSYGHRNPQGLAFDNQGRLWATEHGPQAMDELNLIEKGANYGWPVIQGDAEKEGMVSPIIQSGSTATWAPAGTAFYQGSFFFGGLRGQTLYEAVIENNGKLTLEEHFKGTFGRIRDVVLGPDNMLYITTSNQDGRGTPRLGDDKIISFWPQAR